MYLADRSNKMFNWVVEKYTEKLYHIDKKLTFIY